MGSAVVMKTDDTGKENLMVDFREALKEKLRDELREELMNEVKKELKVELKTELKEELKVEFEQVAFGEEYDDDRSENEYPWLVFDIAGTEYGINSKYVLSIEKLGEVTPVVEAPSHCPGITQFRGDIIELLDLRVLFGIGNYKTAKTDEQDVNYMLVVVEIGEIKRGLTVDQIVSVEEITQFMTGVIGETDRELKAKFISHIALREKLNSPVIILNPEALVSLS